MQTKLSFKRQPTVSSNSSKKTAKKARSEEKEEIKKISRQLSKFVPPPDKSKVIRELVDLTPDGNQKWGEDGTYVDRREGFRTSYGACPRFTVIKGHIYPKLDATALPPPGERVNGKLYPSPHPARFGKWNSGGKGGKLDLSCPWCPYLTKEGNSNRANYSHEEGGEGKGISVCQQCRGVADMPKALKNPCDKCGEKEASYPDTLGGKSKNLCFGCAKENGSYEPLQHKRCPWGCGIAFDTCAKCCPNDKLHCTFCIVCFKHRVNSELYKSGERMCAGCRADAGEVGEDANKGKKGKKVEEERVEELLVECGFKKDEEAGGAILPRDGYFKREHQISFKCDDESNSGKKFCKIDFIVNVSGVFFFLEVDEHQHKYGYGNKDMACDMKRMADAQAMVIQAEGGSLADQMGAPYWVRYNPHSFKNGSKIVDVPREVKERKLMQRLDGSVGRSDEVRIEYFYYDVDAKGELEVLKHPEYHPHFRERAFTHLGC